MLHVLYFKKKCLRNSSKLTLCFCLGLRTRYPMAMGTLADLEDQEPIPGKENPLKIHLKVRHQPVSQVAQRRAGKTFTGFIFTEHVKLFMQIFCISGAEDQTAVFHLCLYNTSYWKSAAGLYQNIVWKETWSKHYCSVESKTKEGVLTTLKVTGCLFTRVQLTAAQINNSLTLPLAV